MKGLEIKRTIQFHENIEMSFSEEKFRKGFTKLNNEILLDEDLKAVDLAVYWAVKSFMYGKRTRWASSYQTLAERAHCSKATVRRSIRWLEERGWIMVHRPRGCAWRLSRRTSRESPSGSRTV